jgi:two-component system sensor histidine kinase KdpD
MHDAHPESDTLGVFIPLRVKDALVGALHVGPRLDGRPFPAEDQRMILALANLAAVVIARQTLIEEAAQAAALREADALKEALLSMVTHELRTPLAAIKAASSGLRQGRAVWTESDAQDAIRTIDAEADRLATIVSNLLDLSRLEAGSWHPAKDWCDLADVAATALDRLPEEDAARVRLEFPDDLPLIRADYVQLALLLTNLLENAAKYAPRPSPIVVRVSPPPGPHPLGAAGGGLDGRGPEVGLLVTVRDYGPGITPGDEEKIFARFYRSARHEQGGVRGTGLGLALCRAIAEAHGGGIRAQNAAPGEPKGAVFTFEIPVE